MRHGVPAAVLDAAEQPQHVDEVHAAHQRHTVLAVGGEHVVLRGQRIRRADLRGLLAQRLREQRQLALPLQGGGLDVEPAGQHHVAVHATQRLRGERRRVLVVRGRCDPLACGGEQADQAVLGEGAERGVGHVVLLPADRGAEPTPA